MSASPDVDGFNIRHDSTERKHRYCEVELAIETTEVVVRGSADYGKNDPHTGA